MPKENSAQDFQHPLGWFTWIHCFTNLFETGSHLAGAPLRCSWVAGKSPKPRLEKGVRNAPNLWERRERGPCLSGLNLWNCRSAPWSTKAPSCPSTPHRSQLRDPTNAEFLRSLFELGRLNSMSPESYTLFRLDMGLNLIRIQAIDPFLPFRSMSNSSVRIQMPFKIRKNVWNSSGKHLLI
jgi:hypothetical protein